MKKKLVKLYNGALNFVVSIQLNTAIIQTTLRGKKNETTPASANCPRIDLILIYELDVYKVRGANDQTTTTEKSQCRKLLKPQHHQQQTTIKVVDQ